MAEDLLLLPGTVLPPHSLSTTKSSSALKIGPGLTYHPAPLSASAAAPTVTTFHYGQLQTTSHRSSTTIHLSTPTSARYIPSASDLVLATIHHSTSQGYIAHLAPNSPPCLLPHTSFENASTSKKLRPNFPSGTVLYARVHPNANNQHMLQRQNADMTELTCVDPATLKNPGGLLGELPKGGMVFGLSLPFCRRLLVKDQRRGGGVGVLEMFGERGVGVEVAVGRNGKVWVKAGGGGGSGEEGGVRATIAVGRALREADEGGMGLEAQGKMVRKIVGDLQR